MSDETKEPRRIELSAIQALRLRDIYGEYAQAKDAYDRVSSALQDELRKITGPDGDRTLWRMDIGEELVELVEVVPDE